MALGTALAFAAPDPVVVSGPTSLQFAHHPPGWMGTFTWTASPGAATYRVYDADLGVVRRTVSAPAVSTQLVGLLSYTYRFYVEAVDSLGATSTPSNIIVVQNLVPTPPPPPPAFNMLPSSIYDASTNAPASGLATIRIPYSPAEVTGDPSRLRLLHYTAGHWEDITTGVDTTGMIVTGQTSSFSPFGIGEPTGEPPVSTPASSAWTLALAVVVGLGLVGLWSRDSRHA